jgi:RNA recognition motif-containing protein
MSKSLFVGNLSYSANEAHLIDLFSEYGAVSARVVEGRGFGFVDVDDEKAETAIEALNEKEFMGRRIVVNEARPREPRSGGGGGGYGGGGGGGYGDRRGNDRRGGGGRGGGGRGW